MDGVLASQVAEMQNEARKATRRARERKVIFVPLGEDW